MKPTLIGIVFFLLGLTSGIVFFNQIDIKESSLVSLIFGDSTGIGTLDPMKATSSPYDAITPRIHGKNIYAPYSSATTSSVYATTFCINNGSPDCITAWSAGGGEANTASNLGTGLNIFDTKSGVDLRFNSISAGTNITLSTTTDDNTIVIASTASGGGGSGNVATSTTESKGLLAYWTSEGATPATLGEVATTSLTASSPLSLSNPISVIGSSASALSLDTSGAWSGTAGSLASNGGNCSAGNAPLGVDQLGAVESCFDVWTEAENTSAGYISDGNTNWDNSYGFTTFAWPFTPSTSWGALAQATSSILQMNGALISSSTIGRLTVGAFTATSTVNLPSGSVDNSELANSTITAGNGSLIGGSGSTALGGTMTYNFLGTFNPWTVNSLVATGTATSTISTGLEVGTKLGVPFFFATSTTATSSIAGGLKISGGGLKVSSILNCSQALETDASGNIVCGTDETTASGYPFTPTSLSGIVYSATTSPMLFYSPVFISSSSVGNLTVGTLTATSTATSTFNGALVINGNQADATSTFSGGIKVNGGGLLVATIPNCNTIDTDANGLLVCGDDATGAGGGAYPFTPTTSWGALAQATTSLLAFPQALISSSTIGQLTVGSLFATTTNRHMLLSLDANGQFVATSTPTVAAIFATSTTATSSFLGDVFIGKGTTGRASTLWFKQLSDNDSQFIKFGANGNQYIKNDGVNDSLALGVNGADRVYIGAVGTTTFKTSDVLARGGSFWSYLEVAKIQATSTATSTFAGGISTLGLSSTNGLTVSGNSTSTFANGINLTGGCFRVNGSCISAGAGGTPGGSDTQIQFNDGGSFGGTNFVYDSDWLGSGYKVIKSVGAGAIGFVGGDGGVDTVGDAVIVGGGNGNGTGNGGDLVLGDIGGGQLMAGGATGRGGGISITAGLGGVTSGEGGSISLTAGSAQGGDSDGGSLGIFLGAGSGAGSNGSLLITGTGHDFVTLNSGNNGLFGIGNALSEFSALFDTSLLTDEHTFSFPDWSGEFAVSTSTLQVSSITSTSTATSTFQGGINIMGGGLKIPTLLNCDTLDTDGDGNVICGTDETGAGGGAFAWTPTTNFGVNVNATTTPIWFQTGLHASSTSYLDYATTTAISAVSGFFTDLWIGVVTLAEYIADTAGAMFTGNTETGITVTYQDADNTVDVVCNTADTSTFGCLTDTDWDTFNGKQNALGFTPANELTTLTVAGTASQITSSAGAQNLSANRTWTLSFPSNIIFPNSIFAHSASSTLSSFSSTTIGNLTVGTLMATSTATSTFAGPIRDKSTKSITFHVTSITASGDFGRVWKTKRDITVTKVIINQEGATNVIGQLQECDSNGANCAVIDSSDITGTDGVDVTDDGTLSNPSVDAGDYVGWSTTSVSGTNTRVAITFEYVENF